MAERSSASSSTGAAPLPVSRLRAEVTVAFRVVDAPRHSTSPNICRNRDGEKSRHPPSANALPATK
jgi:hypothetical protein